LKKAETFGLVLFTKRQFGTNTQVFVSMLLEAISIESFNWVLKSLHIDEMTPNEKAI